VNFHGDRRSNATHASATDPEARLARKGPAKKAKLAYQGHALMENRHGLVVDTCVTQATGIAEREAAAALATNLRRGARKGPRSGRGLWPGTGEVLTLLRQTLPCRQSRTT
jgi:hypothetical protein